MSNVPSNQMDALEEVLREATSIVAPQDVATLMLAIWKQRGLVPPLYLLAEAERNEQEAVE